MITKFKKFFSKKETSIKVGTYVIIEPDKFGNTEEQQNFVRNNVGQVIRILPNRNYYNHKVKYTNVPENLLGGYLHADSEIKNSPVIMRANITQMTHFSDNEEELEDILAANKYNL